MVSDIEPVKVSIKNVVLFTIMFLLSAFGFEFLFFVLTVYVYKVTHMALTVGVFTAVTFLPKLFSPFYGVFVDRYDRRIVMSLNAGLVGLSVIGLGFIKEIEWIYLVWFITTIFIMFISNARTAIMVEVMPTDNYIWGNSIVLSIINGARLLAPLLAGVLMTFIQTNRLLIFTSLIYFSCMIVSLTIKLPERKKIEINSVRDIFTMLKEGGQYILNNKILSNLVVLGIVWQLFLGMQTSLFIVYVSNYLGQGTAQYGLFMTIIGLGSLVGSMVGPFLARKYKKEVFVIVGLSLHFISFIILGLVNIFGFSLIIVFISFMTFYATIVSVHSLRDQSIINDVRGRVYGSITSILTPAKLISMLVCGFLADRYGVNRVFVFSGAFAVLGLYLIMQRVKFALKIQYKVTQ